MAPTQMTETPSMAPTKMTETPTKAPTETPETSTTWTEAPTQTPKPTSTGTATEFTRETQTTPVATPEPDTGLETWVIALLVVGSILGAVLLVGAGFLLYKFSLRTNSVHSVEIQGTGQWRQRHE
uniref:Syndecan domain-containing protein n=1 Tax=Macrostomum lignano TaxID=282301 RepID=A0A1I8GYJ1_9PLAT